MVFFPKNKPLAGALLYAFAVLGGFFVLAWLSYSPFDNGWSTINSAQKDTVQNLMGAVGAYWMDVDHAFFGKLAFFPPLMMLFVPIYLLATGLVEKIRCAQALQHVASLIVLLIALCMLSHVLFQSNFFYLAGGLVGELIYQLLAPWISAIGVLILAVILGALGFIGCSGQHFFYALMRSYRWLREQTQKKAAPAKTPESDAETASQHTPEQGSLQKITQMLHQSEASAETANAQVETPTPAPETVESSAFEMPSEAVEPVAFAPKAAAPVSVTQPSFQADAPHLADSPFAAQQRLAAATASFNAPLNQPEQAEKHFFSGNAEQITVSVPNVRLAEDFSANALNHSSEPFSDENATSSALTAEMTAPVLSLSTPSASWLSSQAPNVSLNESENRAELNPINQASEPPRNMDFATSSSTQVENAPNSSHTVTQTAQTQAVPDEARWSLHPAFDKKRLVKSGLPFPTVDLMAAGSPQAPIDQAVLEQKAALLQRELEAIKVKAKVVHTIIGPVVTTFLLELGRGESISRLKGRMTDLARNMMDESVRLLEMVPKTPYIGIEIASEPRQTVWLRDILASHEFQTTQAALPIVVGVDTAGKPRIEDLAVCPHLLIAGTTGSGKSVGLNALICGMLFKLTPKELRMILIDPKTVELTVYEDIPHLLTPPVTEPEKMLSALNWAIKEMDRRYHYMSQIYLKDIKGFNRKIDEAVAMNNPIPDPLWREGDTMDKTRPMMEKLPYIMIVIDEYAEFIDYVGKKGEEYVRRLAQKARGAGIHLVLATQRPSSDLFGSSIKANVPARIAYTVSNAVNSRIVLESTGAENLLGRGDLLFSHLSTLYRAQCGFMSDDDAVAITDDWRARGKAEYVSAVLECYDGELDDNNSSSNENRYGGRLTGREGFIKSKDDDRLFDEAVNFLRENRNAASGTQLASYFGLGTPKATRLVMALEQEGIISAPLDGRGTRKVLLPESYYE